MRLLIEIYVRTFFESWKLADRFKTGILLAASSVLLLGIYPQRTLADAYVPTIARTYPTASTVSFAIGSTVNFSAYAQDAGGNIAGIDYYVNGAFQTRILDADSAHGYMESTWSKTFTSTGVYNIGAVAVDTSNNTAELSPPWTVTITNSTPSASRTSPSSQSVSVLEGGAVSLQMSAADGDANLKSVEWFVGSTSVKYVTVSGGSASSSYTYNAGAPEAITIYAYVTDTAGVQSFVFWNINVTANVAPGATRNSHTSGVASIEQGQLLTMGVKGADADGNLKAIEWFVKYPNGSTISEQWTEKNGSSTTDAFSKTYALPGNHTIYAYVYDQKNAQSFVYWNLTVSPTPTYNAGISSIGFDNSAQYFGGDLRPYVTVKNLDSTGSFKAFMQLYKDGTVGPYPTIGSCQTTELLNGDTYKCSFNFTPTVGGTYRAVAWVTNLAGDTTLGNASYPATQTKEITVEGAFVSELSIKAAYLSPSATYGTQVLKDVEEPRQDNFQLFTYLAQNGYNRVYINTGGITAEGGNLAASNAESRSRKWAYEIFPDTRLWFNVGESATNYIRTIPTLSAIDPLLEQWRQQHQDFPKKIHINVELFGSVFDEQLTEYIAKFFGDRGWIVGVSVLQDWNSDTVSRLASSSYVDEISFQAYNQYDRYQNLDNLVDDVSRFAGVASTKLLVAFPYFATLNILQHPLEEDIVRFQDLVKAKLPAGQLNGLAIYAIGPAAGSMFSGCLLPMGQASEPNPTSFIPYWPHESQYSNVCEKAFWEFQAFDSLFPGRTGFVFVAPPKNLVAAATSSNQINLAWTDVTNNETGFKIERKTGANGTWIQIGTAAANATSYQDTAGLAASATYYYRVRSSNATGDSVGYSNEANATTFANATVPISPASLSATAVSPSQINLAWTDASNDETGFKIERKTGANGTWIQIGTAAANATSYQDTAGLAASTTYYYRVRSSNATGDSVGYSNEANATVLGNAVVPTSPTNLIATPGNASASIAFSEPSNNGGSTITSYTATCGSQTGTGSKSPVAVTGLTNGTLYSCSVTATNSAGTGPASGTVSVTPTAQPSICGQTLDFVGNSLPPGWAIVSNNAKGSIANERLEARTTDGNILLGFEGQIPSGTQALTFTFTTYQPYTQWGAVTYVQFDRSDGSYSTIALVSAEAAYGINKLAARINSTSAPTWQNPEAQKVVPFAYGTYDVSLVIGEFGVYVTATSQTSGEVVLSTFLSANLPFATVSRISFGQGVTTDNSTWSDNVSFGCGSVASVPLTLLQGWNLLGNSLNQPLSVATVFGDPSVVSSVWKWDNLGSRWWFFTPLLDSTALQTYAAGKNYGVLSQIAPGEGFWVNAKLAAELAAQSGSAFALTGEHLAAGWNLVATGQNVSPSAFNRSLSATPPAPGTVPQNITSLWAWDNPANGWYFYAPSLEAKGGTALPDYIGTRGYRDFTQHNKTLGNGIGFWVNRP